MQLSKQVLFLLFCCTAQPASSLSAGASWSWPWSKSKVPPKSWVPVEANATELVERTESSPAQVGEDALGPAFEDESAPAAQTESAEQLQDRKQKLEGELEAKQQDLKNITGAHAEVDSAAEALKLAEKKATETAYAAEAEQSRVQELQAVLAAKQRELKEVAVPQPAQEQAHEQVAQQAGSEMAEQAGNETAEEAGNETAEQTTTDPLQDLEDQLAAKQRELKVLEAKRKIQDVVEAQQSQLDEAIKVMQAKAQAAEQAGADRAAQAMRLASAQAAEKAQAERLQALLHEVSSKQRELKEVTERARQAAEQARQAAEQAVDTLKEPTQPGCYMRSPSACPKKPMKTTLWRMDSFAVKQGVGKEGCQQRKGMWDKYCGSQDAQMAFVA